MHKIDLRYLGLLAIIFEIYFFYEIVIEWNEKWEINKLYFILILKMLHKNSINLVQSGHFMWKK